MINTQLHCLLVLVSLVSLTLSEDLTDVYLNQNDDTKELMPDSDKPNERNTLLESLLSRPPSPLIQFLFTKLKPDGPEKRAVIKRVFCNGFTGCGGRHRGQRRYSSRLLKRPFCNNWGCGNGKRSRENVPSAPAVVKDLARKRLFCNSYGGCHGGKKRTLYSNWLGKLNGIADTL